MRRVLVWLVMIYLQNVFLDCVDALDILVLDILYIGMLSPRLSNYSTHATKREMLFLFWPGRGNLSRRVSNLPFVPTRKQRSNPSPLRDTSNGLGAELVRQPQPCFVLQFEHQKAQTVVAFLFTY